MPHGFLKHQKDAGRKLARGGGSHCGQRLCPSRRKTNRKGLQADCFAHAPFFDGDNDDLTDYYDDQKEHHDASPRLPKTSRTVRNTQVGECPICFEQGPVFRLLKNCRHAPACRTCLREYYVHHTFSDVTKFPITCFSPGCKMPVAEEQIKQLVQSPQELNRYYRNRVLSKAYKSRRRTVVHCPHCDHPRQFTNSCNQPNEHVINCLQCSKTYYCVTDGRSLDAIVLDADTVRAAESMGLVEGLGRRDGWVLCPHCNLLLSGGDDFDTVQCACGKNVDWKAAKDRVKRISRHARSGIQPC